MRLPPSPLPTYASTANTNQSTQILTNILKVVQIDAGSGLMARETRMCEKACPYYRKPSRLLDGRENAKNDHS
jgi:hypothetical protein